MYFVLQILEAERQSLRHPDRRAEPAVKAAAQRSPAEQPVRLAARAARRNCAGGNGSGAPSCRWRSSGRMRVREEAERRRFIEGYSELAAAGQAAMGLSRSVRASIEQIDAELDSIRTALGRRPGRTATNALHRLGVAARSIEKRISMLAPIEPGERRRRRAIDVPAELASFRGIVGPLLSSPWNPTERQKPHAKACCVSRCARKPFTAFFTS